MIDYRRFNPIDRWMVETVNREHARSGAAPHEFVRWTNDEFAERDGTVKPAAMGRRLIKLLRLRVLEQRDDLPHGRRPRGPGGTPLRVNGDFSEWSVPWRKNDRAGALEALDRWAVTHPWEEAAWCFPGSFARSYGARSTPFIARGDRRYARLSARSGPADLARSPVFPGEDAGGDEASSRAQSARLEALIARAERAIEGVPMALLSRDPSDLSLDAHKEPQRERSASQATQGTERADGAAEVPVWVADALAAIQAALGRRKPPKSLWGDGEVRVLRAVQAIGPDIDVDVVVRSIERADDGRGLGLALAAVAAGRPRPAPPAEVIDLSASTVPEPSDEERAALRVADAAARAEARARLHPGSRPEAGPVATPVPVGD